MALKSEQSLAEAGIESDLCLEKRIMSKSLRFQGPQVGAAPELNIHVMRKVTSAILTEPSPFASADCAHIGADPELKMRAIKNVTSAILAPKSKFASPATIQQVDTRVISPERVSGTKLIMSVANNGVIPLNEGIVIGCGVALGPPLIVKRRVSTGPAPGARNAPGFVSVSE